MTQTHHLKNIRQLLTEGFGEQELRSFCYDTPDFASLYHNLADGDSKTKIVAKMLDYAHQKVKLDDLLAWAEKENSAQYALHKPYYVGDLFQLETELAKVEQAIVNQEALRVMIPEALRESIETILSTLKQQQTDLTDTITHLNVNITETSITIQNKQPSISGKKNIMVYGEQGATIIVHPEVANIPEGQPQSQEAALQAYLSYLISRNRYLQLQGIRSGGRLVHIELDKIYITLRATRERTLSQEEAWLQAEADLAPGEARRHLDKETLAGMRAQRIKETVSISINKALADYKRLVILGDPGSGKTTLARYLTLIYALSLSTQTDWVQEKLDLSEGETLPIILYLRQIGAYLKKHYPDDDGVQGCALLLDFLYQALERDRLTLPPTFFESYLESGRAVLILDGLDEVPKELRDRVARLLEKLVQSYPACRYVVTSRIVGYSGAARLGENFATTTVRDFSSTDIQTFIINWHRLIAIGEFGPGPTAEAHAERQARHLQAAIEGNPRIRELAINPLLLTVIALVHRDRVKLPDRRAELYAEAIEVLLGKWDESRAVVSEAILPEQTFDTGDKRLMLQELALQMHEENRKDMSVDSLQKWLSVQFEAIIKDKREIRRAVERFLEVIQARSGLLLERGQGVYTFSHLTFQEYLAALAIAGRNDYIEYTLKVVGDDKWREVILLQAGHLSTQSRSRTKALIEAIANLKEEKEAYHNLVLAAECIKDVGESRIESDLPQQIQEKLQKDLVNGNKERRRAAARALAQVGGEAYWTKPYGEPIWIEIPAGEFWMGSEKGENYEKPQHKVNLDSYWIAKTPVTNSQYHFFVEATGHRSPSHWEDKHPPKGLENHPVVLVNWHDALAYCHWLSEVTGKEITLPSEAQWEKAARGAKDKREYPWGDKFEASYCNCAELDLGQTTPVGIFPNGASPYGCLDMGGNVWEWTRSIWGFGYPYKATDGREDLEVDRDISRVLLGGAFLYYEICVRCAVRVGNDPRSRDYCIGFRLVVSPIPSLASESLESGEIDLGEIGSPK